MKLRFLAPLLVLAVLVGFFWIGLGLDPGYVPSPFVGKPAPAVKLPEIRDPQRIITNEDLKGQVSLLNVWATWCVGCRAEHDTLLRIAETGIVPIFGLNWKDDKNAALEWLDKLGDPYVATAVDREGLVAIDWGVYGAPETFLIDADGIVLYKHIAPLTMQIWREQFMPRILEAKQRQQ